MSYSWTSSELDATSLQMLLLHLNGCRFGVDDLLIHPHRHHDGVDFSKLILAFL